MTKPPLDPSHILDSEMHYIKGYRQKLKRAELAAYILTYGRDIWFGDKPSWRNLWSPELKKYPLLDKNLGYGIIEVSVYIAGSHRKEKKEDLNQMEYLEGEE
jgi:hypothetical protein